jgi:hypothetical protein
VKVVFEQLRAGEFPNQHKNYWLTRDGKRHLIAWTNTAILAEDTETPGLAERPHHVGEVAYVVGTGLEVT